MDYSILLVDQLKSHLKSLRQARGLTQAQLGRLLGLGQVRIAEIEANPAAISVDQLFKLLSALSVGVVLRDGRDGGTASLAPMALRAGSKVSKTLLPPTTIKTHKKATKVVHKKAKTIDGTATSKNSLNSSGKALRRSASTGRFLLVDKSTKGRW
jgi:transcriptional regulator with XRE-family HTH domain